jgi:hypothetical protein
MISTPYFILELWYHHPPAALPLVIFHDDDPEVRSVLDLDMDKPLLAYAKSLGALIQFYHGNGTLLLLGTIFDPGVHTGGLETYGFDAASS